MNVQFIKRLPLIKSTPYYCSYKALCKFCPHFSAHLVCFSLALDVEAPVLHNEFMDDIHSPLSQFLCVAALFFAY